MIPVWDRQIRQTKSCCMGTSPILRNYSHACALVQVVRAFSNQLILEIICATEVLRVTAGLSAKQTNRNDSIQKIWLKLIWWVWYPSEIDKFDKQGAAFAYTAGHVCATNLAIHFANGNIIIMFIEYRKGWSSPVQGFCRNPLRCIDGIRH
jgi:hypothetical protein